MSLCVIVMKKESLTIRLVNYVSEELRKEPLSTFRDAAVRDTFVRRLLRGIEKLRFQHKEL